MLQVCWLQLSLANEAHPFDDGLLFPLPLTAVGFTTVLYAGEMYVSPAWQWQQRGLPPQRVLRQDSYDPLPAHPLQPGCCWTWIRRKVLWQSVFFDNDREEMSQEEGNQFPFSEYSNEWPTIFARSHFHEMLKLAQKPQQQGRSDSPAAVARSSMAANFHCSACAELCLSCQAAPGNQPHWQSAHKSVCFGVCSIKVALACQSVSQQQIYRWMHCRLHGSIGNDTEEITCCRQHYA